MSLSSLLVDDRYIYIYIRESTGTDEEDEDDRMICIWNERLLYSLAATTGTLPLYRRTRLSGREWNQSPCDNRIIRDTTVTGINYRTLVGLTFYA